MVDTTYRCKCGHPRALHDDGSGECSYELWDDGQWLEEACDCLHYNYKRPGSDNGQVVAPENQGFLTVDVWPTYVGVGELTGDSTITEHNGHPDYERGQIWWDTMPNGDIIGHARIRLPKGAWTHLLFCHGPVGLIIGAEQFEHPVVFDRAGFFDVDPIVNKNYMPR